MDKKIKNKITINELAQMVARGFENTATKDDLKNFATKDDLKNFATKDDLKNFATKDGLNQIWVDLRDFKQETRENFDELNEKIDDLIDTSKNFDKRIESLEEKS